MITRSSLFIKTSVFSALLLMFMSVAALADDFKPLTIYYLRHVQTEANRTKVYNHATESTLSQKGELQLLRLTKKMRGMEFDDVLVSPKVRAMKTILPYLRQHQQVAEVWAELEECCWQKPQLRTPQMPLKYGKDIWIEDEFSSYFKLRKGGNGKRFRVESYADGVEQIRLGVQLIKAKFAGSGKQVLLVGHYHAGAETIALLQGKRRDETVHLSNGKLSKLVERRDGSFALIFLND